MDLIVDLLLGAVACLALWHALGCLREAFIGWYSGVQYEGGLEPASARRRLYLHLAGSMLLCVSAVVAIWLTP